jgi:hypothetical protein
MILERETLRNKPERHRLVNGDPECLDKYPVKKEAWSIL